MQTSRLLIVIVVVTCLLQAVSTYHDYRSGSAAAGGAQVLMDAPTGTVLDIARRPSRGSDKASVVLVEFSDYECPYCRRHATTVEPDLVKEFIETGKVRQVFVNNPLPIHQNAVFMAVMAGCANRQQRFWDMYKQLFTAEAKNRDQALTAAGQLGLDATPFMQCVDNPEDATEDINQDIKMAKALNLTSTPSFAVGRLDSNGALHVVKFIKGAQPVAIFEEAVDSVLSKRQATLW